MSWTKTETGYVRPFGHSEWLYNFFASRSTGLEVNLTTSIRLDTTFSREELQNRLQNAWTGIHYYYPHIGSLIEGDTYVYTPFANQSEVDAWLKESFVVREEVEDPEEIKREVNPRPRLYFFPKVNRVALSCGHVTTDGIGTAHFFNKLLELVMENKVYDITNLDSTRLTVPLSEAIGGVEITDKDIEHAEKVVEDYSNAYPSLGPKREEAENPALGHSKPVVFTEEQTSKLVALAKKKGVTVTSAVLSALVEVLHDDHLETPEMHTYLGNPVKNYNSFTFFNMRHLIKDPEAAKDPFSPFHSCLPVHYSIEGTTEDRLRRAEECFDKHKKAFKHNIHPESMGISDATKAQFAIVPRMLKPHLTPVVNLNSASISSFGVIDGHLKFDHPDLHVSDYTINVYQHATRLLLMFWTFKGKLNLTWLYNEAYYPNEYVKGLQEKFNTKVFEILA